jgi:hypothetical protein
LAGALVGSFAGFFEAIGFAVDGNDLGVVDEAVDEGDDAGGVGEDLAPFGEGTVGGDEGAFLLVAAADEFEQQIGMAVGIGEVSDLVDDQETGAGIMAQAAAQSGVAIEGGEVAEQRRLRGRSVWARSNRSRRGV